MPKAQPNKTATERLAQLREQEQKAKTASNQAEREALLARNRAEQAEQEVVKAHAGHGSLDSAEQALADAEAASPHRWATRPRAQPSTIGRSRQSYASTTAAITPELIAEAEEGAAKPCEQMLEGVRLIVEGDALWQAQAHEIDGHLKAAGQQPSENMSADPPVVRDRPHPLQVRGSAVTATPARPRHGDPPAQEQTARADA